MKKCTKYAVLRYTLIPFLCPFFLCNPMAYTFGVFVEEDYKPAFYDAVAVSYTHLDVYKRQRQALSRRLFESGG